MKTPLILSAPCSTVLLFGALHHANAFVCPSVPQSDTLYHRFSMKSRSLVQPRSMLFMLPDDFGFDLVLGSDESSQLSSFGQYFPWGGKAEDPTVEAGVLTGMAHVALDFSGILFNPSKQMLRLYAVVGRLFVIFADYLPDHAINPVELVVQLFLLSLTIKDLARFGMKMRARP